MDIADQSQQTEDIIHRANLEQSLRRCEAIPIGECLFCGEPLQVGMRWCGAECRDDWQKEYDRNE